MSCLPLVWLMFTGAADTEALKQAQTHFRAGKTHYDLGQYEQAISQFAAGYALVPRPEFLLNLGQAYRRTKDLPRAIEMFRLYLDKAPPNAPERTQVRDTVTELEAELAKAPPPRAAPAPVDAPVDAPPPLTPKPTPTPAVAVDPAPSASRHLAWAIPVGVAVIAGVVTGVVLATQPTATGCTGAGGLGCWDLRPR